MDGESSVVRVAIRIRPKLINKDDLEENIQLSDDDKNCLIDLVTEKAFAYDKVFDENQNQETVYSQLVQPQIRKFIEGFNCITIAYGQTGTGKTYTMGLQECYERDQENAGIIIRSLKDSFHLLKSTYNENYECSISFLEIYNEKIFDLLNDSKMIPKNAIKSEVSSTVVKSIEDALKILKDGNLNRHVRATKVNDVSSRSHAIFSLKAKILKGDGNITSGLYLVDLAGSEGVKRTGNEGQALVEGNSINQGLLAVGKVLQALSNKSKLIPYRDSVLTQILQESLNLKSYVTLLGCVNISDYQGTMSTLRFTKNVKQIKINPQVNELLKEIGRGKTPFKTPFKTPLQPNSNKNVGRNLFYPPLSSVKRLESRHTIGTPRKRQKLDFVKPFNSTTIEEPRLPEVAEFFHPNNFQDALEMIRDVPQPAVDSRESLQSILNVSSSTAKDAVHCITPSSSCANYSCKPLNMSPLVKRIENLESMLENKFQKLYDTFCNQSSARIDEPPNNLLPNPDIIKDIQKIVRTELENIKEMSKNVTILDESIDCATPNEAEEFDFVLPEIPKKVQIVPRRSARLSIMKNTKKPEIANGRVTKKHQQKENTSKKISKETHKSNIFKILSQGSAKELQKLPTIGTKTAYQIISARQVTEEFEHWDTIEKSSIWKKNGWIRFKAANLID